VPLSDAAVALLRRQLPKKRQEDHVEAVFVYRGKIRQKGVDMPIGVPFRP
jgi:hypothetical protein